MSADKYSQFYGLTEKGWSLIEEGSAPDGWVRIYELKVYQGSPFGPESRTWQEPKTHPDWTDNAADLLERKFPRPERSYELSPLDALMELIRASVVEDRKKRQSVEEERQSVEQRQAPRFSSLSFHKPGENISTRILAYFLDPEERHGQQQRFLKSFLDALGIDLSNQELSSVQVQANAPCPTGDSLRWMDILIEFIAGKDDWAIVIESKSHWAPDQVWQVRDYIKYLNGLHSKHKRLYYLKDGERPSDGSITRDEWDEAAKTCRCFSKDYRTIMRNWFSSVLKEQLPQKVRDFLDDFQQFLRLEETKMGADSEAEKTKTRDIIRSIFERRSAKTESGSAESDAIIDLYGLQQFIWVEAVTICMRRVGKQVEHDLREWEVRADVDESGVELLVIPPGVGQKDPLIAVHLGPSSEEKRNLYSFEIYVTKGKNVQFPVNLGTEFEDNVMRIGSRRGDIAIHVNLPGVENIHSAESIRKLLDGQLDKSLADEILDFIKNHGPMINKCVANARSQFQVSAGFDPVS